MNQFRNFAVWIVIALLLFALFSLFQGQVGRTASSEISYTDFIDKANGGSITSVTISGETITGKTADGTVVQTTGPLYLYEDQINELRKKNVEINFRPAQNESLLTNALIYWLPMVLLIGVWIFFIRQMQAGSGKAMGFGKSKAKLLTERHGRVTFEDVAGVEEAKDDLVEIVDFLKDPHKFQRLGGKIPKGALLVGPPGTGKTLLARAIAGEANVPFFTISGSDFVEMFVGVGASRVRDMFEQAKKNAPCIIFIDEIDAVGRHRGAGLGGGNDEREQTLNQLLVEMDGFEANEGVILVAATNRPDVLDPALLRPGRFDRQIVVPNPDVQGREKILKVHMRNVPLAPDIDAKVIARGTPGFSGADLANLVNEAALLAARRNKRLVTQSEFEEAKDKVMMGAERRSMAMSEDEKKLTAYHEAGHALVAMNVPKADPVHKATIIPRGRALGMVMQLPEGDRLSMSYIQMTSRLAIMMGGRIAEEITFGKENVTSGAQSDIEQATRLARAMVTRWGYSDELGTVAYGENQEEVFLGHSVSRTQNVSEQTAQKIDEEVKRLVSEGLSTARQILTDKNAHLVTLAQGLLEYETLSGDEIKNLLNGIPPKRDDDSSRKMPKGGSSVPSAGASKTGDAERHGASALGVTNKTYHRPAGLVFGPDAEALIKEGRGGSLGGLSAVSYTLVEVIERDGERIDRRFEPYTRERALPLPATVPAQRPLVMGIVNVTPDSFSDGGKNAETETAIASGIRMAKEGADILDVGGESTRPGSEGISEDQELARIIPVIEGLVQEGLKVSCDTRKARVMDEALKAGASIINDVSALTHDPHAIPLLAKADCPVVLMHAQGDPRTMQLNPTYDDVALDVFDTLEARIAAAVSGGIALNRLIADPGIGFGKTFRHNVDLLNQFTLFHGLGVPLLMGLSRKGFIGALTGEKVAGNRVYGSVGGALWSALNGAQILRVHDVKATVEALAVAWAAADPEESGL